MYKIPVSVLVVIYTIDLQVLLLERTDHPGYWQSVTGSQHEDETLVQTAIREVTEETGFAINNAQLSNWHKQNQYEIFQEWRWRYEPNVTHNTEHVFGLCLAEPVPITVATQEHLGFIWLPWQEAAEKVFSLSNAQAIRSLPTRKELINQKVNKP